jgi:hypothetical protein
MAYYPFICKPQAIVEILEASYSPPAKPALPPQPKLRLPSKPESINAQLHLKVSFTDALTIAAILATSIVLFLIHQKEIGLLFLFLTAIALYRWYWAEKLRVIRINETYRLAIENWNRQVQEAKICHTQALNLWNQRVAKLEKNYQKTLQQFYSGPHLLEKKRSLIRQVLLQTRTYHETSSKAPRGFAENSRYCTLGPKLRQYFPGKIYTGLLVGDYEYTPDFAYIDLQTGLHICLEIDEPYFPRKYTSIRRLKLTHCIDGESGKFDRFRDQCFTNYRWFVIRISEQQAVDYPDSCCKEIAQLIAEVLIDKTVTRQFMHVPSLQPVPRWKEHEALELAKQQTRLNYNCASPLKI